MHVFESKANYHLLKEHNQLELVEVSSQVAWVGQCSAPQTLMSGGAGGSAA